MMPPRKKNILLSFITSLLIDLPAPINISYMWNFGSILGMCLSLQIMSGVLLTMHYTSNTQHAFSSLAHITREVNWGWALRNFHMNGASIFFMFMYSHMIRGLYFMSFKLSQTWLIGVTIYIITMATAFMGYLLPWGQMSFWGATVITNLFSAIPYTGPFIVEWMWGGFGVSNPTLTRFFTLHYLLPFLIMFLTLLHLLHLHETGSNSPLGSMSSAFKAPFHPMYSSKDILGLMVALILLTFLAMYFPNKLGDPENFIPANPLATPTHIKPEWYFLWAYAILRSIPNKLGGVVTMFSAILYLYLPGGLHSLQSTSSYNLSNQILMWLLFATMIMLTWLGASPVEHPYTSLGLLMTASYFLLLTIMFIPPKPNFKPQ